MSHSWQCPKTLGRKCLGADSPKNWSFQNQQFQLSKLNELGPLDRSCGGEVWNVNMPMEVVSCVARILCGIDFNG